MITCAVELSREGDACEILSVRAGGHFSSQKGKASLPCAVMSALLRTYGRQIESRGAGWTVQIKADKAGDFRVEIESIDPDDRSWYSGVCDFLLCGLGDLMRDYPNEFVMELKRR